MVILKQYVDSIKIHPDKSSMSNYSKLPGTHAVCQITEMALLLDEGMAYHNDNGVMIDLIINCF